MGFCVHIFRNLNLCPETGKPFYYGRKLEKIYDVKDVLIPVEYWRFLYEKNPIYQAYVRDGHYYDTADRVYYEFPSWEDVKEMFPDAEEEYDWTQGDHELFGDALRWFSIQQEMYTISWG